MSRENNMSNEIPNPTAYTQPSVTLIITTYELAEDANNNPIWKATVTHVFSGETIERVYQISEAHKVTDQFYKASFEGRFPYKDRVIILKNSEFEIMKT